MRFSPSILAHYYSRLAPRERLFVQVGAGAAVLVLLALVVSGVSAAERRLRNRIAAKEVQLEEIQKLRQKYLALKSQVDRLTTDFANRPQNFSLFSFLENVGTKTVSREKIQAMNPSSKEVGAEYVEETVEMRLSTVNLQQMVALLHQIENAPIPIRIARLQMRKRFNDPYSFDVTMAVATILSKT